MLYGGWLSLKGVYPTQHSDIDATTCQWPYLLLLDVDLPLPTTTRQWPHLLILDADLPLPTTTCQWPHLLLLDADLPLENENSPWDFEMEGGHLGPKPYTQLLGLHHFTIPLPSLLQLLIRGEWDQYCVVWCV